MTPELGRVTAAVEDDYHCMAVTLHHDGTTISTIDPVMSRAPWSTCPGAPAVLKHTFEGFALTDVSARIEKQSNCTHLHDLAVLAATHANDSSATRYDILVCDAVDGVNAAEIWRNDALVLRIEHRDDIMLSPPAIAGASLFKLRDWFDSLGDTDREAARLLQWATLIAHGRALPMERQSDASKMPPNCYTFQPENAVNAARIGEIIDFTAVPRDPLDHFDGVNFTTRQPNA